MFFLVFALLLLIPSVNADTYGLFGDAELNLVIEVTVGTEYGLSQSASFSLIVTVELPNEEDLQESAELGLSIILDISEVGAIFEVEQIGLRLQFSFMVTQEERHIELTWYWIPMGTLYQSQNYTYYCTLTEAGIPQEAEVHIIFDDYYLIDKTSNASGQFEFWAIVNSAGIHEWSFIIYQDNDLVYLIYEELDYVESGLPDPDPSGPPVIIDLPTDPGSLFVVFDFFPLMAVFGIFGFVGTLLVGRIGILFGGIAALMLTTAMGTLPLYVLFFLILITILVVVYKLKMGGSKVTVDGGMGA